MSDRRFLYHSRPRIGNNCQPTQFQDNFVDPTDLCEMPQSLATAFVLADALSERPDRDLGANCLAALEAVSNRFGGAVDSHGHAINPGIHHALSQCFAGEANELHS